MKKPKKKPNVKKVAFQHAPPVLTPVGSYPALSSLLTPDEVTRVANDPVALGSLSKLTERGDRTFIVASAGNGGCTVANYAGSVRLPVSSLPLATKFSI